MQSQCKYCSPHLFSSYRYHITRSLGKMRYFGEINHIYTLLIVEIVVIIIITITSLLLYLIYKLSLSQMYVCRWKKTQKSVLLSMLSDIQGSSILGKHLPQIERTTVPSQHPCEADASPISIQQRGKAGVISESHNQYKVKFRLTCRQGGFKLALLQFHSKEEVGTSESWSRQVQESPCPFILAYVQHQKRERNQRRDQSCAYDGLAPLLSIPDVCWVSGTPYLFISKSSVLPKKIEYNPKDPFYCMN